MGAGPADGRVFLEQRTALRTASTFRCVQTDLPAHGPNVHAHQRMTLPQGVASGPDNTVGSKTRARREGRRQRFRFLCCWFFFLHHKLLLKARRVPLPLLPIPPLMQRLLQADAAVDNGLRVKEEHLAKYLWHVRGRRRRQLWHDQSGGQGGNSRDRYPGR